MGSPRSSFPGAHARAPEIAHDARRYPAAMFASTSAPTPRPSLPPRRRVGLGRRTSSARHVALASSTAPDDRRAVRDAERARIAADVEAIWRDGGALDGATADAVERTVRGTIAVSRHYEQLIEQQKFNRGKYGEGDVLSDDHADPAWVAARLCLVGRMTGVPSEDVPGMVEVSGAGILSLMAIKDLVPNADASHMVRTEPDLLLADVDTIAHGGRDVMETLRGMDMPEPCVRLLVSEEPGLILGKGGLARLDQVREQAETHAANLRAICEGVADDEWLDVNSQRWFTNFFCGYY
jgi:hypothetical protein